MKYILTSPFLLWFSLVQAANHVVTLGYGGDLVFSPEALYIVPVGDTIEFQFVAGVSNHDFSGKLY